MFRQTLDFFITPMTRNEVAKEIFKRRLDELKELGVDISEYTKPLVILIISLKLKEPFKRNVI